MTETPTVPQPRAWRSYVAIGDSFSEGMSDADPREDGRYLGWCDRLATVLAARAESGGSDFRYANLAIRGRKLGDVVGPQLDAALAMQPELLSMVGGGNDILRPKVDLDDVADRLEAAVVRAREVGIDVLLATPVDPAEAGLLSPLRPRHAIHTANIFTIAQRHGCYVINLWALRALRDWRMWAEDRVHPSTEGHRRIALAAQDALGFDTDRDDWWPRLPAPDRATRRAELAEHAAWVRTHVSPWVQRRLSGRSSGDAVTAKRPELVPLCPDDLPFADRP